MDFTPAFLRDHQLPPPASPRVTSFNALETIARLSRQLWRGTSSACFRALAFIDRAQVGRQFHHAIKSSPEI